MYLPNYPYFEAVLERRSALAAAGHRSSLPTYPPSIDEDHGVIPQVNCKRDENVDFTAAIDTDKSSLDPVAIEPIAGLLVDRTRKKSATSNASSNDCVLAIPSDIALQPGPQHPSQISSHSTPPHPTHSTVHHPMHSTPPNPTHSTPPNPTIATPPHPTHAIPSNPTYTNHSQPTSLIHHLPTNSTPPHPIHSYPTQHIHSTPPNPMIPSPPHPTHSTPLHPSHLNPTFPAPQNLHQNSPPHPNHSPYPQNHSVHPNNNTHPHTPQNLHHPNLQFNTQYSDPHSNPTHFNAADTYNAQAYNNVPSFNATAHNNQNQVTPHYSPTSAHMSPYTHTPSSHSHATPTYNPSLHQQHGQYSTPPYTQNHVSSNCMPPTRDPLPPHSSAIPYPIAETPIFSNAPVYDHRTSLNLESVDSTSHAPNSPTPAYSPPRASPAINPPSNNQM